MEWTRYGHCELHDCCFLNCNAILHVQILLVNYHVYSFFYSDLANNKDLQQLPLDIFDGVSLAYL